MNECFHQGVSAVAGSINVVRIVPGLSFAETLEVKGVHVRIRAHDASAA